MIKCLECGFEAERLQWTHFKYNCSGRFNNGTEYKKIYPDALLVSPSLATKSAVTLNNFIVKYGEDEGKTRWNSYRQKQAESNTFEYKNKKHGWSKDQFDEYNSSRAQTIKKMIERHGEEIGTEKWIKYCQRQAYTNTLNYFIEKYGKNNGIKKYKEVNNGKAVSSNPLLLSEKLKISIDDALELILNRHIKDQLGTWGSKIEKEFTENIERKLGEKLEYTTFSRPFGKWIHELNSYVIYDIKHKDCIIEFNGDYWHANPKIYTENAVIRNKIASEIRERDSLKLKAANDMGFRTYVVWEMNYRQNKEYVINEVIKWIQNGQP